MLTENSRRELDASNKPEKGPMKSLRPEVTKVLAVESESESDAGNQFLDVVTDSVEPENTGLDVKPALSKPEVDRISQSEDMAGVAGLVLLNDIAGDISMPD